MEILTVGEVIDRVAEVGGRLRMEGERVLLTLPGNCPPDTEAIIRETVRANRNAVAAILHDMASAAPRLEEIKAALPAGVRLVSYQPKEAPCVVAPVSVVTDMGKFFRAYLRDLAWRVEHPDGRAAPPLADILSKLGDAGLELAVDAVPHANLKGEYGTETVEPGT